jgi:hypothetical protein
MTELLEDLLTNLRSLPEEELANGLDPISDVLPALLPSFLVDLSSEQASASLKRVQKEGLEVTVIEALARQYQMGRLVAQVTELFNRLRHVAGPMGGEYFARLGVNDYMLLLDALRQGIGWSQVEARGALKRLWSLLSALGEETRGF